MEPHVCRYAGQRLEVVDDVVDDNVAVTPRTRPKNSALISGKAALILKDTFQLTHYPIIIES